MTVPDDDTIMSFFAAALAKVRDIQPEASLSPSARLREELGLDSFAALELLFEIEDQAGIRIPQESASTFQTVSDVIAFVRATMAASAGETSTVEQAAP